MLKLGKLPAAPKATDLKFSNYLVKDDLPVIPSRFGFDAIVAEDAWGMLGNDQYGDCVWAGACHETMVATAAQTKTRPSPFMADFTDKNALDAYGKCTGFTPNDPNSDQGTDVHQAMSFRKNTGIQDSKGNVHKIGAYLSLQPGNMTELFQAMYLFEYVGLGIEFPGSAMDQFNSGEPWSVVSGSSIEGGHYIPAVSRQNDSTIKIVTWGKLWPMTDGFYKKYADEAWAYVTVDLLNQKSGLSARGFNMTQLQADLAAL